MTEHDPDISLFDDEQIKGSSALLSEDSSQNISLGDSFLGRHSGRCAIRTRWWGFIFLCEKGLAVFLWFGRGFWVWVLAIFLEDCLIWASLGRDEWAVSLSWEEPSEDRYMYKKNKIPRIHKIRRFTRLLSKIEIAAAWNSRFHEEIAKILTPDHL